MKRYGIIFLALLILGCVKQPQDESILAKINNYEISKDEFEEEFQQSVFASTDTLESRKEFLNNLIDSKLIMQDAQRQGLDKNKNFLKLIERFWEQSLLKLALDKKTQAIAGSGFVSDKEVKEAYEKMFQEGKTDKTYDKIYSQLKWELARNKQAQMMNDWVAELRKTADIKVNTGLLKKDK